MKTIRVTFKNYSPNGKKRMFNSLKPIFWEVNKAPRNWKDFDGDIEVTEEQPRGGDCFELIINDKKFKAKWIIDGLQKQKDIRSIEEVRIVDGIQKYHLIS